MPAGITHMTISRVVTDNLKSENSQAAKILLKSGVGLYLLGSVAPDLPYMSGFDSDLLHSEKTIADDFHYRYTDQVPLHGLKAGKDAFQSGNRELAESLFCFFVGYCSHLIADGLIHPYIRDHVGDYAVASTAHRTLEMKLDVLVGMKFLFAENNHISLQDELGWIEDTPHIEEVYKVFSQTIRNIYGNDISPDKIAGWSKGLTRALDIAEGRFPEWYRSILGNKGVAYMNYKDLLPDLKSITTLQMPIDAEEKGLLSNFMGKPKVDFFEDVLSQYFELFPKAIEGAYSYIFESGPDISTLIPAIDLDTGRLLTKGDLKETPTLWKQA